MTTQEIKSRLQGILDQQKEFGSKPVESVYASDRNFDNSIRQGSIKDWVTGEIEKLIGEIE